MTREERYHKIDKAFPYEPITSDKEDITRCLDNSKKPKPIVEIALGLLITFSIWAWFFTEFFSK